jgi:hypothetical protein
MNVVVSNWDNLSRHSGKTVVVWNFIKEHCTTLNFVNMGLGRHKLLC